MLQVNKSLTHLDLSQNITLSDSGAQCIFVGLQRNTTLVNLNLSHTVVTATDTDTYRSLNLLLQLNKSLTHLDLSGNNIFSDSGAGQIFESLQHSTNLVSLILSSANITASDPDTARSLSKMLKENKSLTHLDLLQNKISNLGAWCIFEGLQHNTTLVSLLLSGAGLIALDPDTVKSLTKMIRMNKSLKSLYISNMPANQIISGIFQGFKHNSTLLHLHLRGIRNDRIITYYNADCIAKTLKVNRSLKTFVIDHSSLSDEGIYLILQSLRFNLALKRLSITTKHAYVKNKAEQDVKDFNRTRKHWKLPLIDVVVNMYNGFAN